MVDNHIREYLDSVLTIRDRAIFTKDVKIRYQLVIGGVTQVITSKFGFKHKNEAIGIKWYTDKIQGK